MEPTTFPLWHHALTTPGRWHKPWAQARLDNLGTTFQAVREATSAGTIAHARWKDAVETVNRAMGASWEAMRDSHQATLDALPDKQREAFEAFTSYPGVTVASFERLGKKIALLPEHPLADAWKSLYAEQAIVASPLAVLKGLAVKRQPKSPDADPAFTPPALTTEAEHRVYALLDEVLATAHHLLEQLLIDQHLGWLRDYRDGWTRAQADRSLLRPGRQHYDATWHFSSRQETSSGRLLGVNQHAAMVVQQGVGWADDDGRVYGLLPDAEDRVRMKAIEQAECTKNLFLHKNLRKIASIVEAKGVDTLTVAKVVRNEVDLGGLKGHLRFEFDDGSGFTVHNAVVSVVNAHHTFFHRFPLTFHDVRLPDGSPMKMPSEERMNTLFAPVPAAPTSSRRPRP